MSDFQGKLIRVTRFHPQAFDVPELSRLVKRPVLPIASKIPADSFENRRISAI
jgi:hypothetical protein